MDIEEHEKRKAYYREYNKRWYQEHKTRLLKKRKDHSQDLKQWLKEYKSTLYCVRCGENHPVCLQFHHRNPEEKSFTIGSRLGPWKYLTLQRLQEEINKCDVLCGNCHAILHWRETHVSDDWMETLIPKDGMNN